MNFNMASTTAFRNKVDAQIGEATAKITYFEAAAKQHLAQGQLDAIKDLTTLRDVVSTKHDELKTAGEDRAIKIKSDIDSNLAAMRTSIESFAKRFPAHAKAS